VCGRGTSFTQSALCRGTLRDYIRAFACRRFQWRGGSDQANQSASRARKSSGRSIDGSWAVCGQLTRRASAIPSATRRAASWTASRSSEPTRTKGAPGSRRAGRARPGQASAHRCRPSRRSPRRLAAALVEPGRGRSGQHHQLLGGDCPPTRLGSPLRHHPSRRAPARLPRSR
jgi:hypothetical protein